MKTTTTHVLEHKVLYMVSRVSWKPYSGPVTLGLEICKLYLPFGPKHIDRAYFGLFGAPR